MVCEAADHLGGTAVLSTGNVWTVQNADAFRQADPDGDVELWQVVRDGLEESLAWIEGLGVPVRERHKASSSSTYDPPPIGRNVDIESFVTRSQRLVGGAGGVVLNGTTVGRLETGADGVEGARIVTLAGGDEHDIRAGGVVLASGGFQANRDMRAKYLGDTVADAVAVRSNPYSAGAGLTLAIEAGAALSATTDTFYGVILPAVEGTITEADYRGLALHAAVYCVVLGKDGARLTDESAGAVPLANSVARSGRALLVISPAMVAEAERKLGIDLSQITAGAERRGARFASAPTIDAVGTVAGEWGYDGARVRNTLVEFNQGITGGASLSVPRRRHHLSVTGDELLVVEIQAAMTSTYGGVRTNTDGQALRSDGTPVAGLYAAGVDQGGYNVSGYVGGLSRALVFGRRAAANALRYS